MARPSPLWLTSSPSEVSNKIPEDKSLGDFLLTFFKKYSIIIIENK